MTDTCYETAAFVSEKQAARILSMSPRTLQSWRAQGSGPPFIKIGRSVRYGRDELFDWIKFAGAEKDQSAR